MYAKLKRGVCEINIVLHYIDFIQTYVPVNTCTMKTYKDVQHCNLNVHLKDEEPNPLVQKDHLQKFENVWVFVSTLD